jgi:hypothetical protein
MDIPATSFFDDFITRNAPKAKTFEFILDQAKGARDVLVFRTTRDHDELRAISTGAVAFANKALKGQYTQLMDGIGVTKDLATAAVCYHLAQRMVRRYHAELVPVEDPQEGQPQNEEKVTNLPVFSELDFLKMATVWPHGFEDIRRTLDAVLAVDVKVKEIDDIETAKKD